MKFNKLYHFFLFIVMAFVPLHSLFCYGTNDVLLEQNKNLKIELYRANRELQNLQEKTPGSSPRYPLHTQTPLTGIVQTGIDAIQQNPVVRNTATTIGNYMMQWAQQEFAERTKWESLGYAAYKGILYGTIPLMGILMYKGAETTLDIIKYKFTTPAVTILRPETKYGRIPRIKRWWSGYQTPPMIFDEKVKNRLEEIEVVTKNICNHIINGTKKDAKYRNLLLYGKPGTGKTLFAQILADKTNMDFLSVSAGDLLQSGAEGKKYFDDLMKMANDSKYGTILFIDEADGLFINRDTLIKAGALDHLIVLDHILGATGTGNNKVMLIAATNHAYSMDPAMGRRFQDRVEMPLPSAATRLELLNLYIQKKLPQSKLLTPAKIQDIATQTEGLSHAEIKDMVDAMNVKADATKDGILTQRNIDSAVQEAIEKMKALEKDRIELEQKTSRTQPQIQPQIRNEITEEIIPAAA